MKVRKKPVTVEAWSTEYLLALPVREMPFPVRIAVRNAELEFSDDSIAVWTLEGRMECPKGWYLICGVEGEFYPCRGDIFEKTYEVIE